MHVPAFFSGKYTTSSLVSMNGMPAPVRFAYLQMPRKKVIDGYLYRYLTLLQPCRDKIVIYQMRIGLAHAINLFELTWR